MIVFPISRCCSIVAIALLSAIASAEDSSLKLSGLFSDHMVLQRETPVKVSGKSTPGNLVVVELNNATAKAKTDADGAWLVQLPEQKAGGPFVLTVSDSDETTSVRDVLIGDVWVCSGQSNMAWTLKNSLNPEVAISKSENSKLRLYTVPLTKSIKPMDEIESPGQWEISSPGSVPDFSAVGYFFGQHLQQELDVPIGLIESAWGGTRVEWWTPLAGLQNIDVVKPDLASVVAGLTDEQVAEAYREDLKKWVTDDSRSDGDGETSQSLASSDTSGKSWKTVTLPQELKGGQLARHDGLAWYRRSFPVTESEAVKPYHLQIAEADDFVSAVYINDKRLRLDGSKLLEVPAGLIKTGENSIAIQVLDVGGAGGIAGSIELVPQGSNPEPKTLSLAGEWRFHLGTKQSDLKGLPEVPRTRPTTLYNAMIAPLQKFPIRGAIWYQGESNATEALASSYAENFSNMINEWRKGWGVGDFPFLYVQLASFRKPSVQPEESDWAVLREQQEDVLGRVRNTAMASAIDIGEEDDIHPRNKLDVGKRLALGALAIAYDKPAEFMGPIYKSHDIANGQVTITFTHAEQSKTRGGEEPKGFAIAGADGKFEWADARIDGNTVIVSNESVKEPTAVRYGWANYSNGNLYNEADLPASPFRTDKPGN